MWNGFCGECGKTFSIMEEKPQNKFQESIDLLNDAIAKEIATSMQYL